MEEEEGRRGKTTTEETRKRGWGGEGRQPAAPFSLNVFLYCPEIYPLSALSGFQGPADHMRAPTFPLLENKPRLQESWAGLGL